MKEKTTRATILIMIIDLVGEKAEQVQSCTGKQCLDCPVLAGLIQKLRKALLLESEEITEVMRERYGFISKS